MAGRSVRAERQRRRAERRGHAAEHLAALWLRLKGYRILARRYRTGAGEIDLIARRGDLIALVEVKARRSPQMALDAVTWSAQRRIAAAGDIWLSRRRDADRLSLRCDVVAIVPWRLPVHFPGAF